MGSSEQREAKLSSVPSTHGAQAARPKEQPLTQDELDRVEPGIALLLSTMHRVERILDGARSGKLGVDGGAVAEAHTLAAYAAHELRHGIDVASGVAGDVPDVVVVDGGLTISAAFLATLARLGAVAATVKVGLEPHPTISGRLVLTVRMLGFDVAAVSPSEAAWVAGFLDANAQAAAAALSEVQKQIDAASADMEPEHRGRFGVSLYDKFLKGARALAARRRGGANVSRFRPPTPAADQEGEMEK